MITTSITIKSTQAGLGTSTQELVREAGNTPWGMANNITVIAPGIYEVDTPSHGGVYLNKERNRRVHPSLRRESGWYEEDCEASIPTFFFFAEFTSAYKEMGVDVSPSELLDTAIRTMKEFYPHAYGTYRGKPIDPKDSWVLREKLVVRSAFGSWHENVPKGYVGVIATKGGNPPDSTNRERFFLVEAEKYRLQYMSYVIEEGDVETDQNFRKKKEVYA